MYKPKCNNCGNIMSYSDKHDSHYCLVCDIWQISPCDDADCEFCANRPKLPSQMEDLPKQEVISETIVF